MAKSTRKGQGVRGNTLFYAHAQEELLKEDVWQYQPTKQGATISGRPS